VADCPECRHANADDAEFCANPDCRIYLGWATGMFRRPSPALTEPDSPLTRAGIPTPRPPETSLVAPSAAVGEASREQQRRGLRLRLEPTHVTVVPGGVATATAFVRNMGTRVEEFRFSLSGSVASFSTVDPAALSVYPGTEESAILRFTPTRGPENPAGDTPYEVHGRSELHADVSDVAQGVVTVEPFVETGAMLKPQASRGRGAGLHRVLLANSGNTTVGVQVEFSDRDGMLSLDPPQTGATLLPGHDVSLPVRVTGPRRWFGRTQPHPFTAVVLQSESPPVTLNGVRHQVPVFPWWIPTAALAIAALVIAIVALLPGDKVPGTSGLTEVAAMARLEQAGYRVVAIEQPDPTVPKGMAIKTDPAAGAELNDGEPVRLFVSSGPCLGDCPVEIPNIEGLALEEARGALQAAGFKVSRVSRVPSDDVARDVVIGSKPAVGTERPRGSDVVLTVSSGPRSSASPSPSASDGGGGGATTVEIPQLRGQPVADASERLTGLGLRVKTVKVRSNELAAGHVLATSPPAGRAAPAKAEVTLKVAQPTARTDLIPLASQATWRSGAGVLPFPGNDGDSRGFALIRDSTHVLEDGTVDTVLETHPEWVADGHIVGEFQLREPIIKGDHLWASVGLLGGAGGEVEFVVSAGGQELDRLTDGADGRLKDFDVDLSAAQGSRSVEIIVRAGASSGQDWAVWRDLRIEGHVG